MFIKLTNCLEYEDNRYNFGDVEYFIPIKEIKKMRTYKESTDPDWDCYYFQTKEEREAVIEQITSHPVFVDSFNK